MAYGLTSQIKYVRILKREIRGKCRWFAQLVCEGLPHVKGNVVKSGTVGLDQYFQCGICCRYKAGLLPFGEQVPTLEREICDSTPDATSRADCQS